MTPSVPLTDAQLRDRWLMLDRYTSDVRLRINRELRAETGLAPSWTAVLMALAEAPHHRQPMHLVARRTELTSGGFTKLADRMAHEGLITREHSTDDRRIVYLGLTPLGEQRAGEAAAVHTAVLRREFAAAADTGLAGLTHPDAGADRDDR